MKYYLLAIFIGISSYGIGQTVDSVSIPKGVVYKYSDATIITKAKDLIRKELSDSASYEMNGGIVFIGPELWSRYKNIAELNNIPGGNVTIKFDGKNLSGKMTQDIEGFKKIWDQVRKEVKGNNYTLRKPTSKELQYYWAVISFDIEEPLLIAQTNEHRYILNLSPKDLKLVWLDEVPATVK